jgi:predicted Zn-dependent peptidase
MAVFAEIRRRNVLKVAMLYAVASWLILWFAKHTGEVLGLPAWGEKFLWLVIAIGFPVALLFAWTYEFTPSGLKRAVDVDQTQSIVYKTGQKLNAAVAVLLVLGLLSLFGESFLPKFEFLVPGIPAGDAPTSEKAPAEIRSLTLDNGLKIIVWPDHDNPDVAMYNFVRSVDRRASTDGTEVTSFFEHLVFLGAENRTPGEFGQTLAVTSDASNAYASSDVAVFQGLANYYQTNIVTNNRAVIFTGDVTPKDIFALAGEHLDSIPEQEPQAIELEQSALRRIVVAADAQAPSLLFAFHVEGALDRGIQPLNLLLNILVGGESSRLHRVLVEEERLAISVGGDQEIRLGPGPIYFYLALPPGGDPAAAERRVIEELQRVAIGGVTEAELAAARDLVLADYRSSLETVARRADALVRYEALLGDFETLFDVPDDIAGVTAENIRDVAASVFREDNMTVGVLQVPDDSAPTR